MPSVREILLWVAAGAAYTMAAICFVWFAIELAGAIKRAPAPRRWMRPPSNLRDNPPACWRNSFEVRR